jgi:hypothetical protein
MRIRGHADALQEARRSEPPNTRPVLLVCLRASRPTAHQGAGTRGIHLRLLLLLDAVHGAVVGIFASFADPVTAA